MGRRGGVRHALAGGYNGAVATKLRGDGLRSNDEDGSVRLSVRSRITIHETPKEAKYARTEDQ